MQDCDVGSWNDKRVFFLSKSNTLITAIHCSIPDSLIGHDTVDYVDTYKSIRIISDICD